VCWQLKESDIGNAARSPFEQDPHLPRGMSRVTSRRLAKEGKVLSIASGPAGVGGIGLKGPEEQIGKGRLKVTVPNKIWKVVLVLPREDAEPRKNSRVIAVILPNDQSVDFDWPNYRVSTRAVEKLTGFRFFASVPDDVADALRDHVDEISVPVARTRRSKTGQPNQPSPEEPD